MQNIITESLSDKKQSVDGVTTSKIINGLAKYSHPSIYVDSDKSISIMDGYVKVDEVEINITGKTNLELVSVLRDNAVNAYLTHSKTAMYPASLLKEFSSDSTITFDVDCSPVRLSEYHSGYATHLIDLSGSDIDREIISVYSNEDDLIYSPNEEGTHHYEVVDGLLYTNALSLNTKCLMKYKIKKYFLHSMSENILNAKTIIDKSYTDDSYTSDVKDLLIATNGNNKDIL
jgi:hypothetical protein